MCNPKSLYRTGRTVLLGIVTALTMPDLVLAQPTVATGDFPDSLVVFVQDSSGNRLGYHALVRLVDSAGRDVVRAVITDGASRAVVRYRCDRSAKLRLVVRALAAESMTVSGIDTLQGPLFVALVPSRIKLTHVCTADFRPAISLRPDSVRRDSTTVTFTVRDGKYRTQRAMPLSDWIYNVDLAGERAGTYSIEVSARGYRKWTMKNVVVTRDGCHVRTRSFTVSLRKDGKGPP